MLTVLEEKLGHHFSNPAFLDQALTHPSLAYELDRRFCDNQRLEFLGDAALQLSLSTTLYERYPDADEGRLTKIRASLVSTRCLAETAKTIQLGKHLKMGRGEEASGGRERESALADTLEAVLGAVYLDGGEAALRQVVIKLFARIIAQREISMDDNAINPKGRLQELIQSHTSILPVYTITTEDGPPHSRTFTARVSWQDVVLGQGTGPTKKDAEIQAARSALESPNLMQRLGLDTSSQSTPEKALGERA